MRGSPESLGLMLCQPWYTPGICLARSTHGLQTVFCIGHLEIPFTFLQLFPHRMDSVFPNLANSTLQSITYHYYSLVFFVQLWVPSTQWMYMSTLMLHWMLLPFHSFVLGFGTFLVYPSVLGFVEGYVK